MPSAAICAAAEPTQRSSLQLLMLRNNADKPLVWSRLSRKGRHKMALNSDIAKPETATRTENFVWGIPQNGLQHKEREVPQDEPPPLPANAELTYIGKPTERYDGPAKAMGKGKYTADINLPGMLYARMVDATIPHGRILMFDDMHRTNARHLFGSARVDRENAAVGNRRIDHPRIQHAGQIDVGRVLPFAHGLRWPVVTFRGLADVGQFGVCGKRRRLILRNLSLFVLQTILRDAPHEVFRASGGLRLRGV